MARNSIFPPNIIWAYDTGEAVDFMLFDCWTDLREKKPDMDRFWGRYPDMSDDQWEAVCAIAVRDLEAGDLYDAAWERALERRRRIDDRC